jgi:hypothetical protein
VHCRNCGKSLTEGSLVCPRCGRSANITIDRAATASGSLPDGRNRRWPFPVVTFAATVASYVVVRALYFTSPFDSLGFGPPGGGPRCSGIASNPHCGLAALPIELLNEAPFFGLIFAIYGGFLALLGAGGKAGRTLQGVVAFLGFCFVWFVGMLFALFG